ncbi:E3 ubiquitin-protein ligase MARCHF2-like [Oppia nitens]|uniref:E3 ubiquitin-protein ligase MARCHF2-like n=1 Tax=Oppia nitens TaxID=1686743 RepID=UPI0023DCE623|nr:E3 ubiquitin-protein ligase MARCHF2-like [Oppia nitens]
MDDMTECRICRLTDDDYGNEDKLDENPVLSPCNCTGSMKKVHLRCLKSWIETSGSMICSVCGSQYTGLGMDIVRKGKSFIEFLNQSYLPIIFALQVVATIGYLIVSMALWTHLPHLYYKMKDNPKVHKYFISLVILYPIECILVFISWLLWYVVFRDWQRTHFRFAWIHHLPQ